jgi:hypothetical protein
MASSISFGRTLPRLVVTNVGEEEERAAPGSSRDQLSIFDSLSARGGRDEKTDAEMWGFGG